MVVRIPSEKVQEAVKNLGPEFRGKKKLNTKVYLRLSQVED